MTAMPLDTPKLKVMGGVESRIVYPLDRDDVEPPPLVLYLVGRPRPKLDRRFGRQEHNGVRRDLDTFSAHHALLTVLHETAQRVRVSVRDGAVRICRALNERHVLRKQAIKHGSRHSPIFAFSASRV